MDEGPNPDEIEEPGARLDRIAVRMEKTSLGSLIGETSGDALSI
jgi:hypothetical protein